MPTRVQIRNRRLFWAALSLVVVVALSTLVELDSPSLERIDSYLGVGAEAWTSAHHLVSVFLIGVAFAFGVIAMSVYTAVTAAALFVRKHTRAAIWTVGVMVAASLTTTLLKQLFQRSRPVFPDPIVHLTSYAFPSGHASGIASGMGVAIVLTLMLVRRRSVRRWLVATWVFLILLVGADRVLLGVHHFSDVVAGYAVGTFWVMAGLLLYDPTPRARAPDVATEPVPRSRKLAVVLNPSKIEDVAVFRAMVEQKAEETGWTKPVWYGTTIEDPGRSMAEQAAVDGADLVLVCGGDGTVRTVCAELAGTDVPVGVVPAGTGNLLARNLGVPLYLQAAVDAALTGRDRSIDLVAISGDGIGENEHFMVMAGMGFDAVIMEGAHEGIKAKVGWLAYVVSALRNLMFPAVRVEISVDGGSYTRHRARTVVIGNVGYLQAGIPLLPDAAIDDGVLDVVLLSPHRFLSWLPVAVRVFTKNKRTDAALNRMTGRRISVRAAHDTPRQLDGDPIGPGRELHACCVHGRLLVRVPR